MNTPEADKAMKEAVEDKTAVETKLNEIRKKLSKSPTEEGDQISEASGVITYPEGEKEAAFNMQGIGRVTGKDRKKSRTPKMTKRQKHRRDRAMRKKP